MIVSHFYIWSFSMDLKVLLIILQISSLVHTDKNSTIIYQNWVDEPTPTSTTVEIAPLISVENDKISVSDTSKFLSSDTPEFRLIDKELNHQQNIVTEIYKEIDGRKTGDVNKKESATITVERKNSNERKNNITKNTHRVNDYDENLFQGRERNSTAITTSSSLTSRHDNESHPNKFSMNINSRPHIISSLIHSFVNSMWTSFYKPIVKMIVLKMTSNLTDGTQNVSKSDFQTRNSTAGRTLSNNSPTVKSIETLVSNDSDIPSNESNQEKSVLADSRTTESLNSRIYNVSEAVEDSATTIDTITTMSNFIKSRLKNDSLILEIDTTISSTTETIIGEERRQLSFSDKIKAGIMTSLFNAANNSFDDGVGAVFMENMMKNYNKSKIRRPFSARYSRIHNSTSDMQQKSKREIPFNSKYNSADRQELASYFYNDQQIRENYLNYAKSGDEENISPNVYNTDEIYSPDLHHHPVQPIYMRNQDNPTRDSLDELQIYNTAPNIAPNFHTDLNDSFLNFVDKLGYSMFDSAESMSTTTELSIEHELIFSKKKWPDSHTADHQQRTVTRTNSKKNSTQKRRFDSSGRKKSKTRRTTKARGDKINISMKSVRKKNGRKNNTSSSKYLRTRSKYKRRNISKKKRRASERRTSRRRKTKQNRRRTKQSTKSRSTRYRPL